MECCSVTNELVHAMTRMYGALIASVSVVALLLATNETFARPGGGHGGFTSPRSISRSAAFLHHRTFLHHRRNNVGGFFWPAEGYFDQPSNGEPIGDVAPPASGDVRYTSTYDVPWDWAHRFPPAVAPSDHPYVSSCPTETVTVAGRGGADQTINVIRCY
jgi:hypothetical protein